MRDRGAKVKSLFGCEWGPKENGSSAVRGDQATQGVHEGRKHALEDNDNARRIALRRSHIRYYVRLILVLPEPRVTRGYYR